MTYEKFNRLALFLFIIFLASTVLIVGLIKTATLGQFNFWIVSSTAVTHMQSMFQLGAATSIAFAIAGPQIRHALGPKITRMMRYVYRKKHDSEVLVINLKYLIDALKIFDISKIYYYDDLRGNLFGLHLFTIFYNIFLLLWSSLLTLDGLIPNGIAVFLLFLSVCFHCLIYMTPMLEHATSDRYCEKQRMLATAEYLNRSKLLASA